MGRAYDRWLEAQRSPDYWSELAKLEFATALDEKMDAERITRSELAERVSTSKAYISKILGGYKNFTIDTMSKLAFAFGFRLKIDWVKIDEPADKMPSLETCLLTTQAASPVKIWEGSFLCNSALADPTPMEPAAEELRNSSKVAA